MQEKDIIKACRKCKQKGFKALVDQYSDQLLGVCYRYSKNKEDAQDYLQESFIQIFQNFDKYRGEGPLGAWMRRVTINVCLKKLRVKSIPVQTLENWSLLNEKVSVLDNGVLEDLEAEELVALIQKLPKDYLAIFNLHVIEAYEHKEIAEMLDISESTSRVKLMRARKKLQDLLTKKKFYDCEKLA